jgi:hypothetical protein
VEIDLKPQPKAAELRAIERALAPSLEARRRPLAYLSPWRLAGIRESVEGSAQAIARPRSRRGATRA